MKNKGFTKGLKKSVRGEDDSNPRPTNQMSTFHSENERLDPGAFTEIDATKQASAKRKGKMFTDGFKKMKDQGPAMSETPNLYPAPNAAWNISGSDKVAAAAGGMGPMATMGSPKGLDPIPKTMSRPKRVTPDLGPYGAPKGASGVTGVANRHPFQKAVGKFGQRPRLALKSFTRLKRGM